MIFTLNLSGRSPFIISVGQRPTKRHNKMQCPVRATSSSRLSRPEGVPPSITPGASRGTGISKNIQPRRGVTHRTLSHPLRGYATSCGVILRLAPGVMDGFAPFGASRMPRLVRFGRSPSINSVGQRPTKRHNKMQCPVRATSSSRHPSMITPFQGFDDLYHVTQGDALR